MGKLYKIYAVLLFLVTIMGCSSAKPDIFYEEEGYVNSNTIKIDVLSNQKDANLSDFLDDIRYVKLDTAIDASLTTIYKISIIDTLMYIMDDMDKIKCFNLEGKYLRNCISKGKGVGEVLRLGDFSVDSMYLYVLDISMSSIIIFDHNGKYIKTDRLPFRTTGFKVSDGLFLFKLAPYALNNEDQSYEVAVTDKEFNILYQFIEIDRKNGFTSRIPYFENSQLSDYFAPIFGNGVYEFVDSTFVMKYYLEMGTTFPNRVDMSRIEYAFENKIFYTYHNPYHNNEYMIQFLYTSKDYQGVLVVRLKDNKSVFIRNFINDRDDIFKFLCNINGYDIYKDEFFVVADGVRASDLSIDDLSKLKSVINEKYHDYLITEGAYVSPSIMFFKINKNIDKLFN